MLNDPPPEDSSVMCVIRPGWGSVERGFDCRAPSMAVLTGEGKMLSMTPWASEWVRRV